MSRGGPQDLFGVLRGLQIVAEATVREHRDLFRHLWLNSSVKDSFEGNLKDSNEYMKTAVEHPTDELKRIQQLLFETKERCCVVAEGIRQLAGVKMPQDFKMNVPNPFQYTTTTTAGTRNADAGGVGGSGSGSSVEEQQRKISNIDPSDAANLDISSITLKELEEILSKRNKNRDVSLRIGVTDKTQQTTTQQPTTTLKFVTTTAATTPTTTLTTPTTTIPNKDDVIAVESLIPIKDNERTHSITTGPTSLLAANILNTKPITTPNEDELKDDTTYVENVLKIVSGSGITATATATATKSPLTSTTNEAVLIDNADIKVPALSKVAKQRKVPSSRIGRMASFGGLFAGLGFGTINELTKGALGIGGSTNMKEAFLSPANAERIVDTLCKVRGAALKIGQILSIQDSKVVSPQLAKAFERVRQAADYMPTWQVERVMNAQLGAEWRNLLKKFDDTPFAAASIGQVHRGTLKNGMDVAIKIQYPGVAQSIESDIENLVGMLKLWNVFPKGFFIDNMIKVAKRELTWEVDYEREADYTEKFKEMISPYPEYYVPIVIRDMTTSNVLTTELVPGVPLDQCFDLSYDHRKHIGEAVMKLCLRELFELQCMQTDPNWSNFLYDVDKRQLMLIDFGSTRFYQREFIKNYRQIIIYAVNNDRQGVLELSKKMGFLTGYETKLMEDAHVDAVMILGEILSYDGDFDFSKQNTTERIVHLVPIMVAHRLCPPPDEIYSIHRKLSGTFLLCARLNIKMNCRVFYNDIVMNNFKG